MAERTSRRARVPRFVSSGHQGPPTNVRDREVFLVELSRGDKPWGPGDERQRVVGGLDSRATYFTRELRGDVDSAERLRGVRQNLAPGPGSKGRRRTRSMERRVSLERSVDAFSNPVARRGTAPNCSADRGTLARSRSAPGWSLSARRRSVDRGSDAAHTNRGDVLLLPLGWLLWRRYAVCSSGRSAGQGTRTSPAAAAGRASLARVRTLRGPPSPRGFH